MICRCMESKRSQVCFACHMSHIAHRTSHIAHRMSHVACCVSHIAHRMSHVVHRVSHVAHRVSHRMHNLCVCHTSIGRTKVFCFMQRALLPHVHCVLHSVLHITCTPMESGLSSLHSHMHRMWHKTCALMSSSRPGHVKMWPLLAWSGTETTHFGNAHFSRRDSRVVGNVHASEKSDVRDNESKKFRKRWTLNGEPHNSTRVWPLDLTPSPHHPPASAAFRGPGFKSNGPNLVEL